MWMTDFLQQNSQLIQIQTQLIEMNPQMKKSQGAGVFTDRGLLKKPPPQHTPQQ